jgi:hypothetical protein
MLQVEKKLDWKISEGEREGEGEGEREGEGEGEGEREEILTCLMKFP